MKRSTPLRRTPMRRTRPPKRSRTARADRSLPPGFWQQRREALYARAQGRCEWGGCSLNDYGLEAHHRRLRSQGRDHGLSNLAALCPQAHAWVHAHPEAARARGFIVPSWADPATTPMQVHTTGLVLLTDDGHYLTEGDDQ